MPTPWRIAAASFRERLRGWARRRQGIDPAQLTLESRRIYIWPTGPGLLFAVMVVTMLLGAMNYNNNLGFALTFLLVALGVVTLHHCHRTLMGLQIQLLGAAPVFAGESLQVQFALGNESAVPRDQIELGWDRGETIRTTLGPVESRLVSLELPTARRGWIAVPRVLVATRFPLGLVHAWSWIHMDARGLAYPRPAGSRNAPPAADASDKSGGHRIRGEEDFGGLRAFQPGDPPRRIAWKTYARTGDLLVREFRGGAAPAETWIDWAAFPAMETEARIARLTRLVLDASNAGHEWGLRVPGTVLDPDAGPEHLHRSLTCLATLQPAAAAIST